VAAIGVLWATAGLVITVRARQLQALSSRFFGRNPHVEFTLGTDWPEGRSVVPAVRLTGIVFIALGAVLIWFALFPAGG